MPQIKEIETNGYYFLNVPHLFWHSGKFWMHDKEVKQVYNNGSLSLLLYGSSKKSIKQLRKLARPCKIKLFTEELPF